MKNEPFCVRLSIGFFVSIILLSIGVGAMICSYIQPTETQQKVTQSTYIMIPVDRAEIDNVLRDYLLVDE